MIYVTKCVTIVISSTSFNPQFCEKTVNNWQLRQQGREIVSNIFKFLSNFMWIIFKILTTQLILNTTCQFCQQYETGHEHTIVSGSLN